jgi:hypothetical protein
MALDWTLIKASTLQALNIEALVAGVEERECMAYGQELARAQKDEARWSAEQLECLRFAGHVLMMHLRADEPVAPYGPMFVFGTERSAIPDDFPRAELLALQEWALALSDAELRARFLDVMWVQGKSYQAAMEAVDAYMASALNLEHPKEWTPCQARLERALRLAAGLGKGGAAVRDKVLSQIESMLRRHRGQDPLYLSLRLIRLLLEFRYGDAHEFAMLAATGAQSAEAAGDFWRAKDYYQLIAECRRLAGDHAEEGAALRQAAECLVQEAEAARKQPGRVIAAASILSDAVEAMRQAPGGKGRADALHARLLELQEVTVGEMKGLSTDFDATELVRNALAAVRGKSLSEAVMALCRLAKPPSVQRLKEEVHEHARVAVFGSLLSSEVVNSRGRVVARVPGLLAGADDTKEPGLRWRMFRNARMTRGLVVQAVLNPARQEIYFSHAPDRQDLAGLIQHSPWIPPGHAESVMRALLAGFQGDMLVAGHMVPPQLEALVRHVVESRGGSTSMLEPGGLQPERPLGVLLESSEALSAFGGDGVFELQDLVVDPLGTNLRNEIAHGLLDDSGMFGADVLYAWWVLLRFCVVTSKLVESQVAQRQKK